MVTVVLAGSFLMLTESGLRFLVERAVAIVPGTLEIEEVRGRVAGPMDFAGIRYSNGDLRLEAETLKGTVKFSSLLLLKLDLGELRASGLTLHLPPAQAEQPERAQTPSIRAPLTLRLSEGVIEDLTIVPFDAKPIVIDRISVICSIGRKGLKVKNFTVNKEPFQFEVSGGIGTDAPAPISFRYAWSFRPDVPEPFLGEGQITGNWETLTASHRLTSPFSSDLSVRVNDPVGDPSGSLEMSFANLSPAGISRGLPQGSLSGEVTAAGHPGSFSLNAALHGQVAEANDLSAGLSFTRQGPRWELDSGKLESVSTGTKVSFSGHLNTRDDGGSSAFTATWENLAWPPASLQPLLASREGKLTATGRLEEFKAELQAHLEGKAIQPGQCSLSGSGTEKGFTLESFRLPLLGGEVRGEGSVEWFDQLAWRFTAKGSDLDPGSLSKSWAGQAFLSLEGSGRHEEGDTSIQLAVKEIRGQLRGANLGGSVELAAENSALRIERLDLELGTTRLSTTGAVGDQWDLAASFTSDDVGLLAQGVAGSVSGSVTVTGPREFPRIRARAVGDQLSSGSVGAGHASIRADATLEPDAPFTVNIAVLETFLGERPLGTINLTASGTTKKHRVILDVKSETESVSAVLDGAAVSGIWKGNLQSSLLGGSVNGSGSVTLDDPGRWNAELEVEGIHPDAWLPKFPGEISFKVRGKGDGDPGLRQWSARVDDLQGNMGGLPVRGEVLMECLQGRTTLDKLDLRLGRSSLQGSGGITPELALDASVQIASVEEFVDLGEGQAELRISATGQTSSPIVRLEGSASHFYLPSAAFEEASLTAVLGVGSDGPTVVRLRVEDGLLFGRAFEAVSLSIGGTLSSHHGTLLARSPFTDADISIAGQLKEQGWAGSVDGSVLDGAFSLEGGVGWDGPVHWNSRFRASGLKAPMDSVPLPEELSFEGRASGESSERGMAARVEVENLGGFYRGQPLSGQAGLEWDPEGLTIRKLALGAGKGKITLSGQVRTMWDLAWSMDFPDISFIHADLTGAVAGSGKLTGTLEAPFAVGAARADSITYGSLKIDQVVLDMDVDPSSPSLVKVSVAGVSRGVNTIDSATLTAEGLLSDHAVSLNLVSSHGDLNINITGGLKDAAWTGTINRWEISSEDFGNWSLAEAAVISLGGIIEAGPLCLENGGSEICLEAWWSRSENTLNGTLQWSGLGLDLAEAMMPAGFHLEGSVQGLFKLSASREGTALTGQVRTSSGAVTYSPGGEKQETDVEFGFKVMEAEVTLDQDGLRSRVDVQLEEGADKEPQFLLGTLEIPDMRIPAVNAVKDLRTKGNLKLRLSDLDLIKFFTPEVSRVGGIFTADVAMDGLLDQPQFTGRISLTDVTFQLITPGITLKKVDLGLTIDPGNKIKIGGSAASGKGTISADGVLTRDPELGWSVNLKIQGDRFEIASTPYVHALVTPELEVNLKDGKITVAGIVRVPEGRIRPAEFEMASSISRDVTVKGRQEVAAKTPPVKVQADVTVELGEKISFRGFGLTGRINGNIRVTEQPEKPTTGTGELQVEDGEYMALGRTLAIKRGRLVFAGGPVENPGLDVQAVRTVGSVTVGVDVSGTLASPVLTLISDPPLDESDILSYLIHGRPLDRATDKETQSLNRISTALSLAGGLVGASEITQKLGIEEVKIETGEEAQDSALFVGKYLSPRVYVQYGVGLFQSKSIFRFGYELNKRFLLQGESGIDSGADLFYTIERE